MVIDISLRMKRIFNEIIDEAWYQLQREASHSIEFGYTKTSLC